MLPERCKPFMFGALLIVAAGVNPALAQQPAPNQAPNQAPAPAPAPAPAGPESQGEMQKPSLLPPGMMMGPGMMRRREVMRMCDPRDFGLAGWRVDRVERGLELTDEQKAKLKDVVTASAKAIDQFVANCPRDTPLTPTGRLEMMEARASATLEAIRTLRVAFEPFYASLTDEQKARLTPDTEGRRWRFQHWGERERGRR